MDAQSLQYYMGCSDRRSPNISDDCVVLKSYVYLVVSECGEC